MVEEKKLKIDFRNGGCGGHLGFLIGKILATFFSSRHFDTSYQVLSQLAFRFRRGSKQIFKMVAMMAILDF